LFRGLAFKKYNKQPQLRERISKIVEQLRTAGDDRNRLMHDSIYMSANAKHSGCAAIGTMRENPVTRAHNTHRFDVPTIRDLQRRLNELQWILFDLSHKNNDWLSGAAHFSERTPLLT
jgi:hypothetical protein